MNPDPATNPAPEPTPICGNCASELPKWRHRRLGDFRCEDCLQRMQSSGAATDEWQLIPAVTETPLTDAAQAECGEMATKDGTPYLSWYGYMSDHARDLERALAEAKRENERQCLQLIDERDEAEQALGQAYYLVTGTSPEWSNNFGHEQALEEIDGAQQLLRAEIERLKAERQWQPIETAPKDGTWILACAHGMVWQANWSIQYGWNRFNSCDVGWYPTHWMPLPAARTTQEGQG